jgi:hypothetical protein
MFRSFLPTLALAGVALAPTAASQCFLDDNLAGPCCAPASAVLPSFPAFTLPGQSICWDNCNVGAQLCNQVVLAAPVQVGCTEYTVDLLASDCGGNPQLKGTLHLDYTRTWNEFPVPGVVPSQVWRFVVKADLAGSTTAFGCYVPNCLGTHPTAFYHGYLDYSLDCVTGTWESALVLFHGCDAYQHDPALSARPGSFHPGRSFAIVAPSLASNPFVPATLPPLGGPVFFEGMRDVGPVTPPPAACKAEENVLQGNLISLASACVCPFSFLPPQVTARHLDGVGSCGSDFRSISVFPALPWFEMLSTSLGAWSNGSSYPGPEAVWIEEGTFLHTEACSATGVPQLYAEIKVGASTEGGYLAAVGPVGTDRFTDLVDNYSVPLGAPILPPFVGKRNASHHLVYVNSF